MAVIGCGHFARGQESGNKPGKFVVRAHEIYVEARKHHLARPNDAGAAWQLARACFDRAEYATNNTERALIAEQGIAACRQLLARNVRIVQAHYYLGMNLGQLARTKTLGALKIVDEMEEEFKSARALDEQFDYAGPDRNLGLLYLEAPRFASIGDRSKARRHLRKAIELSPDYPENRLNFVEACVKWGDLQLARREFKLLAALWPNARDKFTGPDWEAGWLDWEARLKRLRENISAQEKI
jgi:tetratricopeptide (TPR) repeat protein